MADRHADGRRLYVLLELGLAACGLLFVPASDLLERFYDAIGPADWPVGQALLVKGVASVALLLIPSLAMGGTLPVLVRLVVSESHRFAGQLGWLYGLNTLGGALGALGAVFLLIPRLGIPGACVAAAVANLLAAALVAFHRKGDAPAPALAKGAPPSNPDPSRRLPAPLLLSAAALSGFLSVGLEVLWTRALASRFLSTIYSFALILFVYLLSLGLGSILLALARKRDWIRPSTLAIVMAGSGFAGLVSIHLLGLVPPSGVAGATVPASFGAAQSRELGYALLIIVGPALLFGLNFPLIAALSHKRTDRIGSEVGGIYLANTVGSVVAPLLIGFLVLPWIGLRTSLISLGLAALFFAYAFLIPRATEKAARRRTYSVLLLLGGVLAVATLPGDVRVWRQKASEQLVEYREGVSASVAVVQEPDGDLVLKVNNHYKLGSVATQFAQGRQGLIPLLLRPQTERVLFLGVGTGGSAGPVAALGSVAVDALEILPDLRDFLPYFYEVNHYLLERAIERPDIRLLWADARHYVRTTTHRYDCVIGDLFIPWRAGEGSMYYLEHFEGVRDTLSPEGVFVQWIPLYQMNLEELRTVVATFCQAFPAASLWWLYFNLDQPVVGLVGGREPIAPSVGAMEELLQGGDAPDLFSESGLTHPEEVLGSWIAGRSELLEFSSGAPLETRNHPRIEFRAPRGFFQPRGERIAANVEAMLEWSVRANADLPGWLTESGVEYRESIADYYAGALAVQRGRRGSAVEHFSAGLDRTPDFAWLAFNLEQAVRQCIERDEWALAREGSEGLRRAVRWRPAGTYYLALAAWNDGDTSRARRLAEECLRFDPDYAPARELLARLPD